MQRFKRHARFCTVDEPKHGDYEFRDDDDEEELVSVGSMGDKLKRIMADPKPGPSGQHRGSLPFPSGQPPQTTGGRRGGKRGAAAQQQLQDEDESQDEGDQSLKDKMKGA